MTITPITPTRACLRAARVHRQAVNQRLVNDRPYRWEWFHNAGDDLWALVVTVTATGQRIPISYNIPDAPDVVRADVVAERLMRFAKGVGAE